MSTPLLHYFSLGSLGRGEIVRLFLHELNIDYKDAFYSYDETWPTINAAKGVSLTGTLPILEIDGERLYQHLAILRYLSRRAGAYDGETNYEKYVVDALADIYNDWRIGWVNQLTAKSPDYQAKHVDKFHRLFTDYYSRDTSGPYLLGTKPTYVDFAVFQALDNDECIGAAPTTLSEPLVKLREAILARPNVKDYLAKRTEAK
ncbi:hypothetical protein ACQKWADRAFT_295848 [Trichoderma austrokoningii]